MSQITLSLREALEVCESGTRPKGGVKGIREGVPSLGGEHLNSNGSFKFENIRYVPTIFAKSMKRGHLQNGDVLVVKDGATTGKVSLVRNDFPYKDAVINEHLFRLRPKENLDALYLFYFLFSRKGQLQILSDFRGAAQGGISQDFLDKVFVPVVSLEEQKRVVDKIEKLLSEVAASVKEIQSAQIKLKHYRASILAAACAGKLIPTEVELADIEGRSYEKAADLLVRILQERRKKWGGRGEFKEPAETDFSNTKELPDGWTWATIEQLSEVVRGASPRPAGDPKYFGGNVPWITVGPITADEGIYLTSVPTTLTEEGKEHSRYIESGTLVLTNSGATLGVPKITAIGGCINDGVAALLNVSGPLKLYLYFFLKTQTDPLRSLNQGAAQPNLNTNIIKSIKVPLPPVGELGRITNEIERRMSITLSIGEVLSANLKRAERLRQSILQQAFSGNFASNNLHVKSSSITQQKKVAPKIIRGRSKSKTK